MVKRVVCATCKSSFDPIDGNLANDQAWDCAAEVRKVNNVMTAACFFGSKFDGHVIDVSKASPTLTPGNACDKCVEAVLKNGAQVVEDFMRP